MRANTNLLRLQLSKLLQDAPVFQHHDDNPQIGERLTVARKAFLYGFQEALNAPPEKLPMLLHDLPFQSLGFALEGAAMAVVMLDELSDPEQRGLLAALLIHRTEAEKSICAIGVGWASAQLRKPYYWHPPELNPEYGGDIVDGYGFHQGYFNPYRYTRKGFPGITGELRPSYDRGLGRALWFLHIGRVEKIVDNTSGFSDDRRGHLWQGIGTACAFTGNKEYSPMLLKVAKGWETYLSKGLEKGMGILYALEQSVIEKTLNTYEKLKLKT